MQNMGYAIAGMLPVLMIVGMLGGVLVFVAEWIILNKARLGGWKLLIPVYGSSVLAEAAWGSSGNFWGYFVLTIIFSFVSIFLPFVSILTSIAAIIYAATFSNALASSFGKSGGFAAGLFFLPFIFYPILAFGSAEHYNTAYVRATGREQHPSEEKQAGASAAGKLVGKKTLIAALVLLGMGLCMDLLHTGTQLLDVIRYPYYASYYTSTLITTGISIVVVVMAALTFVFCRTGDRKKAIIFASISAGASGVSLLLSVVRGAYWDPIYVLSLVASILAAAALVFYSVNRNRKLNLIAIITMSVSKAIVVGQSVYLLILYHAIRHYSMSFMSIMSYFTTICVAVGMVVGVLVIAEQGVGAVKEPVALPEKEPAVSLEKKQPSD